MLRRVDEMLGYTIQATDSEAGEVEDFLFDDQVWKVRYLVVDTGDWLSERLVLLAPESLGRPQWTAGVLPVDLSERQIESSPPLDRAAPVSMQHEFELAAHYGWDRYWLALHAPGDQDTLLEEMPPPREEAEGARLRSARQVDGYVLHARAAGREAAGGEVGRVTDFLIDDEAWTVRYLVVDTGGWLSGKQVLVAVDWIERVDWTGQQLFTDLAQDMIQGSPGYDPSAPVTREEEIALHDYYQRPQYWV